MTFITHIKKNQRICLHPPAAPKGGGVKYKYSVHSFVNYSIISSSLHSFIRSFKHSLSCPHSFILSFISLHPYIHSFVHSNNHYHVLTHSFSHSSLSLITQSSTRPFTLHSINYLSAFHTSMNIIIIQLPFLSLQHNIKAHARRRRTTVSTEVS